MIKCTMLEVTSCPVLKVKHSVLMENWAESFISALDLVSGLCTCAPSFSIPAFCLKLFDNLWSSHALTLDLLQVGHFSLQAKMLYANYLTL